MLARVHGQCGWANMTSVGFSGERARRLSAGQAKGATSVALGVLEYRKMANRPPKARVSHRATRVHHVSFARADAGAAMLVASLSEKKATVISVAEIAPLFKRQRSDVLPRASVCPPPDRGWLSSTPRRQL